MDFEELIETYGVWAVLFGGCFEGELVNTLAGIGAGAGLLPWPWVILAGWTGTFCATQAWFFAGKYAGSWVLERRPQYQEKVDRSKALMEKWGIGVLVFYRFLYGLRTITPFAIGMSGVSTLRFMAIDGFCWLVWLGGLATLGYMLGDTALAYLEIVYDYQKWFFAIVVTAVVAFLVVRKFRSRAAKS